MPVVVGSCRPDKSCDTCATFQRRFQTPHTGRHTHTHTHLCIRVHIFIYGVVQESPRGERREREERIRWVRRWELILTQGRELRKRHRHVRRIHSRIFRSFFSSYISQAIPVLFERSAHTWCLLQYSPHFCLIQACFLAHSPLSSFPSFNISIRSYITRARTPWFSWQSDYPVSHTPVHIHICTNAFFLQSAKFYSFNTSRCFYTVRFFHLSLFGLSLIALFSR